MQENKLESEKYRDEVLVAVGSVLSNLRETRGVAISQAKAYLENKGVRIPKEVLGSYEAGYRNMSIPKLLSLLEAYDTSFDEFARLLMEKMKEGKIQ